MVANSLRSAMLCLAVSLLLVGCGGSGGQSPVTSGGDSIQQPTDNPTAPTPNGQPTDFKFTLPVYSESDGDATASLQTLFRKLASAAATRSVSGQLLVIHEEGTKISEKIYDWQLDVDLTKYQITTKVKIDLVPGSYNFYFLLNGKGVQFGGKTPNSRLVLEGGLNEVPMVLNPILGTTVKSVTDLKTFATFPIEYNPKDASTFTDPKLGVSINGVEQVYSLNSQVDLDFLTLFLLQGTYVIQVRLYDGALLVGRADAEPVTLPLPAPDPNAPPPSQGLIQPLEATATVFYDPTTGASTVNFSIPQDVTATSTAPASAVASLVGPDNSLVQQTLDLTASGANLVNLTAMTVPGFNPGEITWSLAIYNGNGGMSAYCAQTVTLAPPGATDTTASGTYVCKLNVLGSALAQKLALHPASNVTVSVNDGKPVAGAVLAVDSIPAGITGAGQALGTTAGSVAFFVPAGSHRFSVSSNLCDATGTRIVRTASSTVTIVAGQENTVPFTLSPVAIPTVACGSTPGPVTNLVAVPSSHAVNLTWTNPAAPFTGVTLVRSVVDYPQTRTDGSVVAETDAATAQYLDSNLENGQVYYYTAFSHDAVSVCSTCAKVQVLLSPSRVTQFMATASDEHTIALQWTNPADLSFTGVTIRRSTSGYPATQVDDDLVADLAAGTVNYADSGLKDGVTYYYSAFAHDGGKHFSAAANAGATTPKLPPPQPGNVTDLKVVGDPTVATLSWTNPISPIFVGVTIRRSTSAFPAAPTDGESVAVDLPDSGFADRGLTSGTTYYYTIFTRDSLYRYSSGAKIAVTLPYPPIPSNVTGLAAATTETSVTLNWVDPTETNFTGVLIVRSTQAAPTSPTDGTKVADLTASATSFVDSGRTAGTTYYYTLFSHDALPRYSSGASLSVTLPTPLPPPVPSAPGDVTNLKAGILGDEDDVALSWSNPSSTTLTGVMIRRSTAAFPATPTDGTLVADLLATSYADRELKRGTTYYYTLFTHDGAGNYSGGARVSIALAPISAPGNVSSLTAVVGGDGDDVDLDWVNPTAKNLTGVTIRRSTTGYPKSPTDGTRVADLLATHYTDADLPRGATYYYTLFAHDNDGHYATGATVSVTVSMPLPPPPKAPGNVTHFAATLNAGKVSLSWTNPTDSGFTAVTIRRSTAGFPSAPSDGDLLVDTSGTSAVDSKVQSGTTIFYTAFAHDAQLDYASGASVSVAVPPVVTRPTSVTIVASRTAKPANGKEVEVDLDLPATVKIPAASDIVVLAGNADFYLLRLDLGEVKCYYLGGKWDAVMKGSKESDIKRVVKSPTCTGDNKAGSSVYVKREIEARVITGDPAYPTTTLSVTIPVLEWHERSRDERESEGRR
jgi:hypothetical protein